MKKVKRKMQVASEAVPVVSGEYARSTITIPRSITPEMVRSAMRADLEAAAGTSDFVRAEIEKIINSFEIIYAD